MIAFVSQSHALWRNREHKAASIGREDGAPRQIVRHTIRTAVMTARG